MKTLHFPLCKHKLNPASSKNHTQLHTHFVRIISDFQIVGARILFDVRWISFDNVLF